MDDSTSWNAPDFNESLFEVNNQQNVTNALAKLNSNLNSDLESYEFWVFAVSESSSAHVIRQNVPVKLELCEVAYDHSNSRY